MLSIIRITIIAALLLLARVPQTKAQFLLGFKAGVTRNILVTGHTSDESTKYRDGTGYSLGIPLLWQACPWFAVESGLDFLQKNYRTDQTGYFEGIYQVNRNGYIQCPLLGKFSLREKHVSVYTELGVYMGYWWTARIKGRSANILNTSDIAANDPSSVFDGDEPYTYNQRYTFDPKTDNRFELGWIAGLGLSYKCSPKYEWFAEVRYTSAEEDQVKQYQQGETPRYNLTLGFETGLLFKL